MARLLGWRPYHSSISTEERSEAMKLWKDGAVFGLAATSMLNCCLDYPNVCYVFHLGPPRDAFEYYQAIGRAAREGGVGKSIIYFDPSSLQKPTEGSDPFGREVIYNMLRDMSLCRRLRPSFFLDGTAVPCAMFPRAQLCDICMDQSTRQPQDAGLCPIPDHLAPSVSVDTTTQPTPRPNLPNQPALSATFPAHLAAANSCLSFGAVIPTHTEELGHTVHIACEILATSCVNCWCNGLEYHSHSLDGCRLIPTGLNLGNESWRKWVSIIRLPTGCCFYCGCPQKVGPHFTNLLIILHLA